jgi:hypothetical protein
MTSTFSEPVWGTIQTQPATESQLSTSREPEGPAGTEVCSSGLLHPVTAIATNIKQMIGTLFIFFMD